MAKYSSYTFLCGALAAALPLMLSPIADSRKRRQVNKPVARTHSNNTDTAGNYGFFGWLSAGATYYGGVPNGFGNDDGACGYHNAAVGQRPDFNWTITAGSPAQQQKGGKGNGACFEVKCTSNSACSGQPGTVVITHECPSCPEIDMSGTSMGRLSAGATSTSRSQDPFQQDVVANKLRAAGMLKIHYMRVPCKYTGVELAFRLDKGSNPFYFEMDGDLSAVHLKEAGCITKVRVPFKYTGVELAFRLDRGANPFYFEIDGDLSAVHLKEAGCSTKNE